MNFLAFIAKCKVAAIPKLKTPSSKTILPPKFLTKNDTQTVAKVRKDVTTAIFTNPSVIQKYAAFAFRRLEAATTDRPMYIMLAFPK